METTMIQSLREFFLCERSKPSHVNDEDIYENKE